MKRPFLLLFACCLAFSVEQAFADLAPTVMLRHNKQSTMFNYYQVQNAVDAAVEGDTISLSEGTFRPFNIDKRIMVRGAGPTTMIEGSCEINISGSEKLFMPVLDAMDFSEDIIVTQAPEQLTFRKCKMKNIIFSDNEFYDVKIDRCWITNRLNLPSNVKEFYAFNSKIQVLYPHNYKNGKVVIEHCNIYEICDKITAATFNSTYIYRTTKLAGANDNYNLISCILNSCFTSTFGKGNYMVGGTDCVRENCYVYTLGSGEVPIEFNGTRQRSGITYTSALDGTVIGAYGASAGHRPYNRYPEVPGVTKHQINIDAATKTMTVTLTVDKLDKQ